jgi:translation initiation factor 5
MKSISLITQSYHQSKMSKINIQGLDDVDDPFYRYRMTKLDVTKIKNRTLISNFDLVCKDIQRDPKFVANFYKKKLGIAVIHKDGILSTTANLDYTQCYQVLREFIDKFVLCKKCRLPETDFDKQILSCRGCGYVDNI